MPTLPRPSFSFRIAVVCSASVAYLSLFNSMESSIQSASIISCTLICDLFWFNLCNSVFECSLEENSTFLVLAASALGLIYLFSFDGMLPLLCPATVTACTVSVRGSNMKDPVPPCRLSAGSCRFRRLVLDIDIRID